MGQALTIVDGEPMERNKSNHRLKEDSASDCRVAKVLRGHCARVDAGIPRVTCSLWESPSFTIYKITVSKPSNQEVHLGMTARTLREIPPGLATFSERYSCSSCTVVDSIVPGSVAEEAGIIKGDILCRSFGNERLILIPYGTLQEFVEDLDLLQKTDVVSFYIARYHDEVNAAAVTSSVVKLPDPVTSVCETNAKVAVKKEHTKTEPVQANRKRRQPVPASSIGVKVPDHVMSVCNVDAKVKTETTTKPEAVIPRRKRHSIDDKAIVTEGNDTPASSIGVKLPDHVMSVCDGDAKVKKEITTKPEAVIPRRKRRPIIDNVVDTDGNGTMPQPIIAKQKRRPINDKVIDAETSDSMAKPIVTKRKRRQSDAKVSAETNIRPNQKRRPSDRKDADAIFDPNVANPEPGAKRQRHARKEGPKRQKDSSLKQANQGHTVEPSLDSTSHPPTTLPPGAVVLKECDVIVGRYPRHPGNVTYALLLWTHLDAYRNEKVGRKLGVAQLLVDLIRQQGGRFIKRSTDGFYYLVSLTEASRVASEAFKSKVKNYGAIVGERSVSERLARVRAEQTGHHMALVLQSRALSNHVANSAEGCDNEPENQGAWPPVLDIPDVIDAPSDVDVIVGTNPKHPGNATYKAIVASHLDAYRKASLDQQIEIGQLVVDKIDKVGGRFVQQWPDGRFHIVSTIEASRIAFLALKCKSKNCAPDRKARVRKACSSALAPVEETEQLDSSVPPARPRPIPAALSAIYHDVESVDQGNMKTPDDDDMAIAPTDDDVLVGRFPKHPGNVTYHAILSSYIDSYRQAKSGQKKCVAQLVVDEIINRGGRFLKPRSDGSHEILSTSDASRIAMVALVHKTTDSVRERKLEKPRSVLENTTVEQGEHFESASSSLQVPMRGHHDEAVKQRELPSVMEMSGDVIEYPDENDVIVGHHPKHPGNVAYRSVVLSLINAFRQASTGKRDVAQLVVDEIKKLGGRFVNPMPDGRFHAISPAESTKIALIALGSKSHALRQEEWLASDSAAEAPFWAD